MGEYLCTPRLFQLTGSSFTFDEPLKGHKRVLHKYSTHENSSERDHENQKSTATETRPSFSPLIYHTNWFLNLKLVRTSKGIINLTSHN